MTELAVTVMHISKVWNYDDVNNNSQYAVNSVPIFERGIVILWEWLSGRIIQYTCSNFYIEKYIASVKKIIT